LFKIHCCGEGYSCDESGKRCTRRLNQLNKIDIIPSSLKFQSIKKENKMEKLLKYIPKEDQLCPDERTKCSSTSTCCPNKQNNEITYSCCPYSKVKFILKRNFSMKSFRVYVVVQMDLFVVQIIMIVMNNNYLVNTVIQYL